MTRKLPFGAFIFICCIEGILSVKIRQLTVPSTVEAGSENILLDCDFDYDADERVQLDIKWYFNNEPSPFYTWVPEKMSRPQIIGERFRNHVDLDHVVQHVSDSHKKHRALLLKRPTTELSGIYTCKVSTFVSEDVRRKKMTVYSPATKVTFQQEQLPTGHQVNVSCSAKNIFPQPRIKLTWGLFEFDDSEAIVEESIDSNSQSGYDIVVHRLVDHSDLPPETVFGCVLTIPGTSYEIREESIYRHHSGRYSPHLMASSGSIPINNLVAFFIITGLAVQHVFLSKPKI